jgi:hypothetical protein
MVGIDISGFQPDDVPGPWEFVVVKLSEGSGTPNPRFDAQWQAAKRTTRGVYHYARPALSGGARQANFFADKALAAGFRPGTDLWQLDAEDGLNEGVGNWHQFITDFMAVALERLGHRGFLYAGWPFLVAHRCTDLPAKFKWWLPDYGPDNGQYHEPSPAVPMNLVVIHQFTSHPMDQNRVINQTAYAFAAPTPPPKPPKEKLVPQYRPAFVCAGVLQDTPQSPARAGVQPDGAVFVWDAKLGYHGGANGKDYFRGHEAAELVHPNAAEKAAGKVYVILDTMGHRYAFPEAS